MQFPAYRRLESLTKQKHGATLIPDNVLGHEQITSYEVSIWLLQSKKLRNMQTSPVGRWIVRCMAVAAFARRWKSASVPSQTAWATNPIQQPRLYPISKEAEHWSAVTQHSQLFFADLILGAQEAQRALADHGVELLLVEMRGYDIEEQVRRIDWLVSQKIDMLVLTPFDDSRIAEKINELTKQGIEVLTVNSDICNSDRVCYVGIDFERSGHIAAGLLGLINHRANVLIVNGSPKLMSHGQRVRGFMDTIQSRFPEVRLVATVVCNDDNFAAYDLVRQKLQDHPDIDMVYIVGEGITGVCAAISEFTLHQIDVICFDDVPHTKELFEEGRSARPSVSSRISRGILWCSSAITASLALYPGRTP